MGPVRRALPSLLPGKQHLQPGLSGASPTEQWGLSEPRLPAASTPSAPAHGGGGTHPSWLEEIPLAPNTVLNVDELLQVFLWAGAGWGEMVSSPSRVLISSLRAGVASASEEENGAQKDLAQNLTSSERQDCDLSPALQEAVCGLPIHNQASPPGPAGRHRHPSAQRGGDLSALLCPPIPLLVSGPLLLL